MEIEEGISGKALDHNNISLSPPVSLSPFPEYTRRNYNVNKKYQVSSIKYRVSSIKHQISTVPSVPEPKRSCSKSKAEVFQVCSRAVPKEFQILFQVCSKLLFLLEHFLKSLVCQFVLFVSLVLFVIQNYTKTTPFLHRIHY